MSDKMIQISASVKENTVKSIQALARKEERSFSQMVDILLGEAVFQKVVPILDNINQSQKIKSSSKKPK